MYALLSFSLLFFFFTISEQSFHSLPAVRSKLEKIHPPPQNPWSPAPRDALDLSVSLEHPPCLQHGQPRLLGTLLLTPAAYIVSEDDVAVNAGSFAGCTLSGILRWLHLVLPAAVAHGQQERGFAGCVSVTERSCAVLVPWVLLLSRSRCFPTGGHRRGAGGVCPGARRLGHGA